MKHPNQQDPKDPKPQTEQEKPASPPAPTSSGGGLVRGTRGTGR